MTVLPSTGRVLGLDWGSNRIGVAISDETQLIATPLATLTYRTGKRLPLAAFLTLIARERPVGLIVGVAVDDQGREGDSAAAARTMGQLFAERSGLPVTWTDESFSTVVADALLTEAGYRKPRTPVIDAAAAATLLRQWLEQRRSALP